MTNQPETDRRSLGVTFTPEQQADVIVWAPAAKKVSILVNDGTVSLPLTKQTTGYWHLCTDQVKAGDLYKFVINDEVEYADPAALRQPQGFFGPSQAFDSAQFYWEDTNWINPPIDEYIIYELDVRTFTAEGTLAAVANKLDYLKRLGINTLVVKTTVSLAKTKTRPNAFPYAVEEIIGGPAQLQYLINTCHFENMAILLELDYNQSDRQPNGYSSLSPYARKQTNPSDKRIVVSDDQRNAYQHYLIENVLMWFRDFHVDGLRLNSLHTVPNADELLQKIREAVDALSVQNGQHYYLLVEQEIASSKKPLQTHQAATTGYYQDNSLEKHRTKLYREDYVYDQQFSEVLRDLFDREEDIESGEPLITISQDCHQANNYIRNAYAGQDLSLESVKLMAGYIMVSPCIPTLFMGEEWGIMNPFEELPSDEETTYAGLENNQLTPGAHSDDSSTNLPWNVIEQMPNPNLYQYYRELTAMRRQQPALFHMNHRQMELVHLHEQQTILSHRWYKASHVLCLMNFSDTPQTINIPTLGESWQKLIDSADPIWQGPQSAPEQLADGASIDLQPKSIVVYKARC